MEATRLNSECIDCLLKKYLKYYPENANEAQKVEYMQKVLAIIADASMSESAPELVDKISGIQESVFGFKEDYTDVKHHFNKFMMCFESELKSALEKSDFDS